MRERHDVTRARETPIQPLVLALLALACRTEQTLLAELTNAERAAIGTPEHWSPRDLVAHSASWRRLQTGKLDAATRGKPLPVWRDEVVINQLNAETCATNQHRPWDDIYAESVRIYEGLMAQIARMTEDMLTGNTGKNGNGASSPPRVGEGIGGEVNPGKNGNGAPSLTPGNQTPAPPRRGGGRGGVIQRQKRQYRHLLADPFAAACRCMILMVAEGGKSRKVADMASTVILFLVVVAFAWNLGAHYTGAVMGMPYAARAISLWPALVLIGAFTILGATFASGGVEETVGRHIIADQLVTVPDAIVIVLAAGTLTMLYTYWKVPTSTIQIFVFCIVGVGLAGGIPIAWPTIGQLAIIWVLAPIAALILGFLLTRLLDLIVPPAAARVETLETLATGQPTESAPSGKDTRSALARAFPGVAAAQHAQPPLPTESASPSWRIRLTRAALRWLPALLVAVGMFASFVLGANDVANATGAFILTHQFSLRVAGLIGGLAMAIGTLTWGRRILHTVAFDVVKMDLTMASAAQGVQALVVLAAVTQGFFTSLNQAMIGAMAGTGLARGRETVRRAQLLGILRGWLIGPLSGLTLAFALEWLVRWWGW